MNACISHNCLLSVKCTCAAVTVQLELTRTSFPLSLWLAEWTRLFTFARKEFGDTSGLSFSNLHFCAIIWFDPQNFVSVLKCRSLPADNNCGGVLKGLEILLSCDFFDEKYNVVATFAYFDYKTRFLNETSKATTDIIA